MSHHLKKHKKPNTIDADIEKILNVSYRFDKKFQGELKIGDKFVEKECKEILRKDMEDEVSGWKEKYKEWNDKWKN